MPNEVGNANELDVVRFGGVRRDVEPHLVPAVGGAGLIGGEGGEEQGDSTEGAKGNADGRTGGGTGGVGEIARNDGIDHDPLGFAAPVPAPGWMSMGLTASG